MQEEKSSNPKRHKSFFVVDIATGFTNLLNLSPRIRGQGGLGPMTCGVFIWFPYRKGWQAFKRLMNLLGRLVQVQLLRLLQQELFGSSEVVFQPEVLLERRH